MNSLDIKSHNDIIFSIKSNTGSVAINDATWDFIFDFHKQSKDFYFIGNGPQFEYLHVEKDIAFLADEIIYSEDNHFQILLKLRPGSLLVSRNLLNRFWEYYEYPAIVFVESAVNKISLTGLARGEGSYDSFVRNNDGVSVIFRSFELDVMWVAQNPNNPLFALLST